MALDDARISADRSRRGRDAGHGPGELPRGARLPPGASAKDALVARLKVYVVVGSGLAKRQWLHFGERMLYLLPRRGAMDCVFTKLVISR